MNFKRFFQVGGPMLLALLSFALVENFHFTATNESAISVATPTPKPSARQLALLPEKIQTMAPAPPPRVQASLVPAARTAKPQILPAKISARAPASTTPEPELAAEEPMQEETSRPAPAAEPQKTEPRKSVWLWLSAGAVRHNLQHSLSSGVQSKFKSNGAPALGLRAGFEVEDLGIDISYESAPGKVSSAPNATVEGSSYHWNTLRGDATWRGLGHDLKIRAGAQQQTSPLLYPDATAGRVYLRRARILFAALGIEWSPRLSEKNRLEARATYWHALGADTLDRAEIELSRKASGSLSLGLVHSAGDHLRLGTYWQSDIQQYGFGYRSSPGASQSHGTQKITAHSLELRIGWEY